MTGLPQRHGRFRAIAVMALLGTALWLNVNVLTETYGAGPPYFGRTTNMDKWSSPWPWLGPVDVVAALAILGIMRPRRRPPG